MLRKMDPNLPPRKATFDYMADVKAGEWVEWASIVPPYK